MILTCPNCSTRYLIASAALGDTGRDVRCAKCSNEWFQEPDQDFTAPSMNTDYDDGDENDLIDNRDQFDDDYEEPDFTKPEHDIPEGVKPNHKTNVPAFAADVIRTEVPLYAKMMGYMASLVIFALIIGAGITFKQKIVMMWPPAIAIYELAGVSVPLVGQDLAMESLVAEIIPQQDGADILILKGRVMNLADKAVDIPKMIATLRSTNGENGNQWVIDPPVDQVEAGASFAFTSEYGGVPKGVGSVNLTFVPSVAGS